VCADCPYAAIAQGVSLPVVRFPPQIPHIAKREQEDRATCCGMVRPRPIGVKRRHFAVNRSRSDRIRYAVLCGCVVLMTAWLTMTVAGVIAGGVAGAIVR